MKELKLFCMHADELSILNIKILNKAVHKENVSFCFPSQKKKKLVLKPEVYNEVVYISA